MLFLDTNVVIDILGKKRPQVRQRFAEAKASRTELFLSSIALYELRTGARLSVHVIQNDRAIDAILADGVELVMFDGEDAREAAAIGAALRVSGSMIGPYDLLIAAQARRRGATLVTHNVSEFARVPGLTAVDWAG